MALWLGFSYSEEFFGLLPHRSFAGLLVGALVFATAFTAYFYFFPVKRTGKKKERVPEDQSSETLS